MYLLWLALFVGLPTAVLWIFAYKLLIKYWKSIFLAICATLLFSIPWDIFAIKQGIWYFPKGGSTGIMIGILPLEEYLFMIFVTLFIASYTIFFKYTTRP